MVRLLGLADGTPTVIDGQWLVEYDPARPGVLPDGTAMPAHVVTTPDAGRARVFATSAQAYSYAFAGSGRRRAADGMPDRPLTAYTLLLEPVDETTRIDERAGSDQQA